MRAGSVVEVLSLLALDATVTGAKLAASVVTGSPSLVAESARSLGDCARRVARLADPAVMHSAERSASSRRAESWASLGALIAYIGGGTVALIDGVRIVLVDGPASHASSSFAALAFSSVAVAAAAWRAYVALGRDAPDRHGRLDPRVAEAFAATAGWTTAVIATVAATATDHRRYDGVGGIVVGVLLLASALYFGRGAGALAADEAAPDATAVLRDEVARDPRLGTVTRVAAFRQGPSEVVLAVKLSVQKGLVSQELVEAFGALERRVKTRCPDVKALFVEPDTAGVAFT